MGPNDPDNPKTWSKVYRWYVTALSALLLLNATFASSIPEGAEPMLENKFGFGREVATLTISLFVAGYCVGPLVWGPLSESVGRKPVFVVTFFVYTGFQVGCALSQTTAQILVFRFLSGTFAAAPLANSGAVISDMWDADIRGKALAVFTLAPFAGPTLGPVCSGFMANAGVSWRWVFWLLTCFAGTVLILVILTFPETYAPVLLVRRAKKLRKETGDSRYWAPLEKKDGTAFQRLKKVLARPFVVLIYEPMLIAMTLYMSFIYGCIYLLFEAYPVVFTGLHGFDEGFTGLTFLPVFIGGCFGVILYLVYFNPRYERKVKQFAPNPVPPEYRLEVCMVAAPFFAAAFFWFGWTSFRSVSFWAPMLAGLPLGGSIVFLFLGLFNYTIDAYLFMAASALSAMTVVRSTFGAGFPLFAYQLYNKLDPRWASTLLGFIATALAPIPFVLRAYGHKLRLKSRYSPTGDLPIKPPSDGEKRAQGVEP
ncbi:MFS general substrate transporter [Dichomitus squalens]|uniref:MFS general substrate transporter n=1 Tax=Dichomitus squalens TaxID=114155 RepID=A0A4Q9NCG4_9APHY|nr:MFS general substrate transporter [Dichomitus squalens]TBU51180.1 MFS general substrate transporter [Dichomitus squalens]